MNILHWIYVILGIYNYSHSSQVVIEEKLIDKNIQSIRTWHLFNESLQKSTSIPGDTDNQKQPKMPYRISPVAQSIREAWNLPPPPPSSSSSLQSHHNSYIKTHNDTRNSKKYEWNDDSRWIFLDKYDYQQLRFDEAIDIIYNHQHPHSCQDKHYLISSNYNTGFGSEIHIEGYGLAIAMQTNRIYVSSIYVDPRRKWQVPPSFCDRYSNAIMCYYESWTNCSILPPKIRNINQTIHDWNSIVKKARAVTSRSSTLLSDLYYDDKDDDKDNRLVKLKLTSISTLETLIPYQLRHIVNSLPIDENYKYYWWRAVSAAYITRLNSQTIDLIQKIRIPFPNKSDGNHSNSHSYLDGKNSKSSQCIGMYVRHGDKAIEMKLHDFQEYADIADYMWQTYILANDIRNNNDTDNDSSNRPNIIVVSETLSVFEEAIREANKRKWNLYYNPYLLNIIKLKEQLQAVYDHQSKHSSSASIENRYQYFMRYAQNQHQNPYGANYNKTLELEYPLMISNLVDLMQCDVLICTLGSNYCRLLDELRVMIAGKVNIPFIDLSEETCKQPPCGIYSNTTSKDFKSFEW